MALRFLVQPKPMKNSAKKNLAVYFIEKVPGEILKGLGWVKLDYEIAHRLKIPIKYIGIIFDF